MTAQTYLVVVTRLPFTTLVDVEEDLKLAPPSPRPPMPDEVEKEILENKKRVLLH